MAQQLVDARTNKNAKLVTFDVRMSETAAQSDDWYPIKPGTDAIVALAIAHTILEKNLMDSEFIQNNTNTTIRHLRAHLQPYTTTAAERESGVQAAAIEKLALEFTRQKPAVAILGGGASDHENGTQNVRCISLLNWITGNLKKQGGIVVPSLFEHYLQDQESSSKTTGRIAKNSRIHSQIFEAKRTIDTYFAVMANPAYEEPDCRSISRFLRDEDKVPLLVVMDTHQTETAKLADFVLPAATYLEGWGLEVSPSLEGGITLSLRQPAISLLSSAEALRLPTFEEGKLLEDLFRPRGEAKEVGNFCIELSRRMGKNIEEKLPYKNTREFVSKSAEAVEECDFESLKQKGFWSGKLTPRYNQRPSEIKISSSRAERVSILLTPEEDPTSPPMPEYTPVEAHRDLEGNEFVLTMYKSNLWGMGTTNSKWAREIFHSNRLWMNREAAARLKISNGDRVRILSPVGACDVRVLLTGRIHPQSVALAEGLGHEAVGRVAKGQRFASADSDTSLIWWTKAGNGVNPYAIIERRTDISGGGYALKDTVVRIEKI
jgi:anaerobic selenocysteine-containing dehydrogenase